MNSDEMWLLYMWSGVFASAVGGGVAMLVLWRTNAHQSKLANRQLADQKSESKRARCATAIGDLVAAVEQIPTAAEASTDQVNARVFAATSALTRLRLEDLDEETIIDTRETVKKLGSLALDISEAPSVEWSNGETRDHVCRTRTLVSEISEGFVELSPILMREVMGESRPDDAGKIAALIGMPGVD